MSKRIRRVPVTLDPGEGRKLSEKEIKMILRGADELISLAGRSMLVKLLKGSKDKKVLELKLDQCPAYGFYQKQTMEEISHMVDWCICQGYLEITYDYRLPMLKFSQKGWEIERETFSRELYRRFEKESKLKRHKIIAEMETVNREVKFRIIEIAAEKGKETLIPILDEWKETEVKKIRAAIDRAEEEIRKREDQNRHEFETEKI